MDIESDTEITNTPPEITTAAKKASESLLPQKSWKIYDNTYQSFINWSKENNVNSFSENVILTYLAELRKKFSSNTLWSNFSMLKSTIKIKHNINIGEYPKVIAYLKKQNEGYVPKKSRVLEKEQILTFINTAPDEQFLLTKVSFLYSSILRNLIFLLNFQVILIFGVAGALRRDELYKLKIDDVEDLETLLVVSVNDTKTKISRKFTISEHLQYYKKYLALRPENCEKKNLFLNYQKGKCTQQVVGINKIGKVPCDIATYLKLPYAKNYTGHCFRRSSATLLVEAGGDLLTLKQHGGWKSSAVAESYIENSMNKKIDISNKILSSNNTAISSTSTTAVESLNKADGFSFKNLNYCTININYVNKQ